jgi:hypothetical protein
VQALAEPSAVLITVQVQRQVAGLFVVEKRGCHQLKGVPEPVTLFWLIRASRGGRRSGVRQLTRLVGREEEMAMLMRRWKRYQKPKLLVHLQKLANFSALKTHLHWQTHPSSRHRGSAPARERSIVENRGREPGRRRAAEYHAAEMR